MNAGHGLLFDSGMDLLRRLKRRGLIQADAMTKDDRYQAQRLIGSNLFTEGDELLTVAFVEWLACSCAVSLPTPPTIDSVLRYLQKPAASHEQWKKYKAHVASIEHRDTDEAATAQLSAADELMRQNTERRRTRRAEVDSYDDAATARVADVLSGWRNALRPTADECVPTAAPDEAAYAREAPNPPTDTNTGATAAHGEAAPSHERGTE